MTYLVCFALIWIAPIYERAKKLENISIHYAIPSNNINALCGAVVIQLIDNRLLCVDFKLKVMVMFTSKLYLGIKIDRIQSMEDIFGIWNWKWQRNKTMWQIVKSNGHIFSWSFSMKLFENFNGKKRLALSILKWQTTELACNHFLIK